MELEKMQTVWTEMSAAIASQKTLTNQIILEMTKERYRKKIGVISKYESIGSVLCFLAALTLLVQIFELDTWYLLTAGVFSITYLIVLPILVLRSILRLKSINISGNTLAQTIRLFRKRRLHFLRMQRMGIFGNFILLFMLLPVVVKLIDGKDIFLDISNFWYWYIPFTLIILAVFSKWGYAHYKRMTKAAEDTLASLGN